jgi:hypothetical protein
MDRSRHQWRPQTAMLLLAVAVGTAGAMRPSIPKLPPVEGYNGCFDEDGALIRDLKAHVAAGKPVLSQLGTELKHPLSYHKSEYGRRPKYLFHWTKKKVAKIIADAGCIEQTEASGGDAYLGEGVYMTAIPNWADPDVVRKNNYGGAMWKNFSRWNSANAYVRVDYAAVYESRLNMKIKAGWQSNFCIRVPMGKLLLTPRIGARISWTPTWDRQKREWRECEEWDWPPPGDWRWEYM